MRRETKINNLFRPLFYKYNWYHITDILGVPAAEDLVLQLAKTFNEKGAQDFLIKYIGIDCTSRTLDQIGAERDMPTGGGYVGHILRQLSNGLDTPPRLWLLHEALRNCTKDHWPPRDQEYLEEFRTTIMREIKEEVEKSNTPITIRDISVEDLELSRRTLNVLRCENMYVLGDVLNHCQKWEHIALPGLGVMGKNEIERILRRLSVSRKQD